MSRAPQEGQLRRDPEGITRVSVELKIIQHAQVFYSSRLPEKVSLGNTDRSLEDVARELGQDSDVLSVCLYRTARGGFEYNGRPVKVGTGTDEMFGITGVAYLDGTVVTKEELYASEDLRSKIPDFKDFTFRMAEHAVVTRDNKIVWPFNQDRDIVVSSKPPSQSAK